MDSDNKYEPDTDSEMLDDHILQRVMDKESQCATENDEVVAVPDESEDPNCYDMLDETAWSKKQHLSECSQQKDQFAIKMAKIHGMKKEENEGDRVQETPRKEVYLLQNNRGVGHVRTLYLYKVRRKRKIVISF